MSANPRGPMMEALTELHKAVTTGVIDAIVPEDLEAEAHNLLWRESDPQELTLLKLCPSTDATAIQHEFDQITSYGEDRGNGFFGEETLPLETEPGFTRVVSDVRIMGEMSSTFLLASLEKTIKVEGQTGADQIARTLLQKSLLRKKNRAMYFSDTSVTRAGANSLRFKGLLQQIREGTDGTVGTSPYGSHIIDMRGQPFTIENIRQRTAQVITLYGFMNCLVMDPFARADLEASMDPAQRLPLPISARAFMLGQHIGGFTTQGGSVYFHTDNTLTPLYSRGRYIASAMPGATSAPGFTGALNAVPTAPNVSSWLATDAGSFFWLGTEIKNERESLGTRWPTGTGVQAVAAGEEVAFTHTPADALSDSWKIYRGTSGDADTDAYMILEIANSGGGGAVTSYDLNAFRPNTSYAFGLNIRSDSSRFLHTPPGSGQRDAYAMAVEESANFLGQKDSPQNTVTLVKLGPDMGVMELAAILATTSRPLLYSACTMQVRNPLQNLVFINIGTESNPG